MASISNALHTAVQTAVSDIAERATDGSFLEETLRTALQTALPPEVLREQKLGMTRWPANLGGVDLLWRTTRPPLVRVGIETKVTDVEDSLYDLLKLVGAVSEGAIHMGALVIAGTERNWARGGVMADMTQPGPAGASGTVWATRDVLGQASEAWSKIWSKSAAKPRALPRQFITQSLPHTPMPLAPSHEVRVVKILAADPIFLAVNSNGGAGTDQIEHAWIDSDDEEATAAFQQRTMTELARLAGVEWSIDEST
jgi:hypothetical protein